MTHYAMELQVRIINLKKPYYPTECWIADCKEEVVFLFDFMDMPFSVCTEHVDEFFAILKLTFGIFLMAKRSEIKPKVVVEPEEDA